MKNVDIHSIPEAFQSKIRLAIIASLVSGEKTFTEIKAVTKATDGNISVHLSKLEEIEYISVKKEFVGKKPCTTYSLTDIGFKEFQAYVKLLEQILKNTD